MTQEIESIGLGMDTSGVERGIKALDVLASKGAPVEKAMAGIEGATERTGKSLKSLGDSAGKGLDDVAKKAAPAADGLKKVEASASEAEKSVKSIGKGSSAGLDALGKAAASASTGMRGLGSASTAADKGFRSLATAATEVAAAVRAEAAALTGLQAGFGAVNASNLAAAKSMEEFRRAVAASTSAVESLAAKATALDKLDQAGGKAASGVNGLKSASEGASQSMLALASAGATAFIGSALVRGVAETTKAIYEASAAAQRFQTTLDFASGGRGAQEIAYLRVVTKELGLQFNSTAQAYAGFQAAAKGTALEGQKARAVFESIAKASAVMGLSADQTSGVLLALQQMISKGTVQAEELRGQLGERLPGAFQIAAKAMGVTTAELGKMLERGEVVANDFLPKFAKALEENLGGAAEKAATRLDASVNRVDAAFNRIKQNAGDSGISKFVAGQYEILADGLDGVSTSMERARAQGAGFFGQLAAGSGAVLKFINPLQAFSYSAVETGNALKQAEAEMARLQARGDDKSKNIYIQNSYFQLQEYIKELRRAKDEQDKLTGSGSKDPRDQSGFPTRTQSITAENERVAGVQAAMAKVVNGLSGVKDGFYKDLNALYAGYKDGLIGLADYQKQVAKLIKDSGTAKPDAGANAALNDSLAAQVQAYKNADDLIIKNKQAAVEEIARLAKMGAIGELDAVDHTLEIEEAAWAKRKANFDAEIAQAAKKKNSAAEVARISGQAATAEAEYQRTVAKLTDDSTAAQYKQLDVLDAIAKKANAARSSLEGQLYDAKGEAERIGVTGAALGELTKKRVDDAAAALEQQAAAIAIIDPAAQAVEALRAQAKAMRDLFHVTGNNSAAQAVYDYGKAVREQNAALQYELSLMGLSEQQRNVLLEQKRIELDLEKQIEAIKARTAADPAKQAELIGNANADAAIAKANAANKAFLDEWKTSVGKYDDIFRQGFADMLNSGKDGWKSFTKSLATTFKTTVADTLYKAFAQPFVVNIVGNLLGLTGAIGMSAVSSGSNALGLAGNAASLYGMGSRAMGFLGFGASAATTTGIGVGTSLANPGMAAMINPVAGTGAATGGFGSMLASIPGWGWALAGIGALGMLFSKKSTPHSGAGAIYSDAMGLQTGAGIYNKPTFGMGIADEYNAETSKAVGGIAKGLAEALDGVAKTFGKTAGFEIATAFADDSSKDGAWGQLRISQGGKDLLNWAANPKRDGIPKEFADGEAGRAAYIATIAQDTRKVMLGIGLPSWADTMLNSIGELSNMDQLSAVVQQIAEVQAMFVHLGDTLVGFAGMTDKAFEALLKASGGAQALAANADAFYQGFYSDSERKDIAKRQLSEKLKGLGVDISLDDPEAKAKYRKLVEEQLAKANGEEAARSALKGSIAGALTGGGIDGLRGMDVGSIVRGVLGDAKDLTQADIDKLTSGITSLDTAGMSLDGLKDSVGKLLEPIVGTGKGAAETAAALLGLSGEFAGLTASADDLAEAEKKRAQEQIDARDKALRGLERSIAKEKEALQSRIDVAQEIASTMGGLFDLLHQNVRDLYGEVDSTRSMLAAQGNDFINQALQAARTTGYLPDQSQLADAISAARSGIDPGAYTSQFAADRDRLVLAGKLSELEGLTGKQLSSAERTVKELQSQSEQLDKTLDYWKEQIDIANGTYEATLSVADAIKNLTALTFPEKTPQQPGQPGSGGGPVEVVGGSEPGAGSTPAHPGQRTKDGGYYREVYLGDHSSYRATNADETARLNALADETKKWVGTGDVRGLLLDAKDSGYSLSDLATVYGWSYKDLLERAKEEGVPRFERGGLHAGGLRLVGERGWEVEATGPARYWNQQQLGQALSGSGNTARLEALVEVLTQRVESLQSELSAIRGNTGGLPQLVDQFDSVSNNGSALRNRPVTA